ncbi:MAG: hypothetical protein HQK91_09585 [Nitrospirae bacterium]|nr:hypothetical protein [Nitrospirota bacterium]
MNNLSITSGIFILLLLTGPMLMRTPAAVRRYLFYIINIVLYAVYLNSITNIIGILVFVIPTFLYIKLMKKRSAPAWPMIIIVLGMFFYLNGYIFIFLKDSNLLTFKLLGLSYILFRQLDILIQMNSGLIDKIDIVDYLNYLFSFWTIMAGPIQRFNEFKESIYAELKPLSEKENLKCLHRAANGMIKVLVIGLFFDNIVDNALKHYPPYNGNPLMFLSQVKYFIEIFYSYPLFLYFNFSGYCDVVIAMGKWSGFTLPENFDKPYLARNVIEFWNRWHITLSLWVKDYLFQPLFKWLISGILSKHILKAQYLSIFITFFLVGLWHGATVNFAIFGILQGIGMAASMYYRDTLQRKYGKQWYKEYLNNKKIAFIERFICLHYFSFSLMFFIK